MAKTDAYSGITTYAHPDELQDVLFNGVSAKNLQLLEVKIWPDGSGYILCLRSIYNPEKQPKMLIDGQYLTHTYYGQIEVIP